MKTRSQARGIGFAVIAACLFAGGALAVQPVIDSGYNWAGALAIRSTNAAVATLAAGVLFSFSGKARTEGSKVGRWGRARYVLSFAAAHGGLYLAIAESGAPLAVALQNLAPVLLVIWFAVVARQRQSASLVLAATATTLGIIGLVQPWNSGIEVLGIIGGVVCAVGEAGLTLLGERDGRASRH